MSLSFSIIKPSSSTLIYEKSFVFRASFVKINNQRLHRYPHDAMDIIQRHKQRRSFLISRLLMAPKMSITLRNGMRITTKQFWNMKSIVLHSLHVEHWCFERVTENVGGSVPFQQYHGLSKGGSYYIRFKYTQRSDLIEWHVIDSWCCSCFWRVSLQRRKKKKPALYWSVCICVVQGIGADSIVIIGTDQPNAIGVCMRVFRSLNSTLAFAFMLSYRFLSCSLPRCMIKQKCREHFVHMGFVRVAKHEKADCPHFGALQSNDKSENTTT